MLLTAFALDVDGTLRRNALWGLLAGAMMTSFVGLGVAWCYMVPKYRETFYKVGPNKSTHTTLPVYSISC